MARLRTFILCPDTSLPGVTLSEEDSHPPREKEAGQGIQDSFPVKSCQNRPYRKESGLARHGRWEVRIDITTSISSVQLAHLRRCLLRQATLAVERNGPGAFDSFSFHATEVSQQSARSECQKKERKQGNDEASGQATEKQRHRPEGPWRQLPEERNEIPRDPFPALVPRRGLGLRGLRFRRRWRGGLGLRLRRQLLLPVRQLVVAGSGQHDDGHHAHQAQHQ